MREDSKQTVNFKQLSGRRRCCQCFVITKMIYIGFIIVKQSISVADTPALLCDAKVDIFVAT